MIKVFMIGMTDEKGGVEAYIQNLTSHLDANIFEIVYAAPEMTIDGKKWKSPENRHNFIEYYRFWRKFYKENRFDVVYFNTCDIFSIDPLIFAKKAKTPVRIIHSHSAGVQTGNGLNVGPFHRIFERISRKMLGQHATELFACSQLAGEWMFDGKPFQIIKNGIDLSRYYYHEAFDKNFRETNTCNDDVILGFVGRITPVKNPLFAVEVMQKVLEKTPKAKLLMIGDGGSMREVQAYVKEKNLTDSVIFTGAVDNVNEWLSAIDCLMTPSVFEGLGIVVIEAQAAGIHSVVSTGVPKEADLTGTVHFLSLEESKETWAEELLKYCSTPRASHTKELLEAGYSIEDTAQKVSTIIQTALRNCK